MSTVKKHLIKLVAATLFCFILINTLLYYGINIYYTKNSTALTSENYSLKIKQNYFLKNQHKYNVAFIGDSRTFCGIDPILFDSATGTSSLNLAVFAFWLPSQYCYFTDFLPQLDTTVTLVWTLGTQNFLRVDEVNDSYPISMKNMISLRKMGFPLKSVKKNFIEHSPPLFFLSWREKLYNGLSTRKDISLATLNLKSNDVTKNRIVENEDKLEKDYSFSKILKSTPVYGEDGHITSYENLRNGGNYIRFEIDSLYFRKKQIELGSRFKSKTFTPDPEYVECFTSILKLMKEHHVKLIVNEIEEAPCMYSDTVVLNAHRKYMKEVQNIVQSYGFKYVRVNFDTLENWHYFDYNHLNSKGVFIYNQLLGDQLKPLM